MRGLRSAICGFWPEWGFSMGSNFNSKLAACLTAGVAAILVLVPFHGFLTVWAAHLFGHYTAWRLWEEFLLVLLTLAALWLTFERASSRREAIKSWPLRLMLAYVLLQGLVGVIAFWQHQVNAAALGQGVIEDVRLPVIFFVAWAAANRGGWLRERWQKLLMWPATLVVVFAVLQYTVLPHNFLSHFGYNASTTIAPIETINHNPHYIRVQSTLRGANELGAYLVIVLSLLGVLFLGGKRKLGWAVFGAAALAALYASGSRSAWIGAVVSLGVLAWLHLKTSRARLLFGAAAAACVLVAAGGYVLLKDNASLQNEVLHTQTNSAVKSTSDAGHASALKRGVKDVLNQPFGRGPGTAGPASVHNNHPARLAENYFLQIGQETGWLGLGLFLAVTMLLAKELWCRRSEADQLSLVLFASLIGLSVTNMLLPAWTDDTLAYIWWGLAGIALAHIMQTKAEQHGRQNQKTTQAAS